MENQKYYLIVPKAGDRKNYKLIPETDNFNDFYDSNREVLNGLKAVKDYLTTHPEIKLINLYAYQKDVRLKLQFAKLQK